MHATPRMSPKMRVSGEQLILYSYIATLQILMILTTKVVYVRGDWLMNCGDCRCKWNSGKKTGDCKNLNLTSVPENLSSELQVLDLSFNKITFLEENAFLTADLQNLHKLFIRNSSLENLDPLSLRSLEILIELDLSNNLLRRLQANIFANLVKVRALVLNGNLLESLDEGTFQNLKYLHKVELKDNRITHVANAVFVNVPLLSQIYLSGNRLNFLRKEPFEALPRLTSLSLELNPWNCTCELQIFRDFALRRNLYTPPTSCYYPTHLRGMLWIEDQPEAFACKPKIIYPSRGASINTSKENVTLICRVHASPNTLIAWDYNKQMYTSSNPNGGGGTTGITAGGHHPARVHVQLLREEQNSEKEFGRDIFISRLTILGAEKSDEGIYTCLAENAGGKDAVQMSLLVQKQSQKDLLLQSNLIIVICLMALGLLSASVFLAMVTCCIYKRFKAINLQQQQQHHFHSHGGALGMTTTTTTVSGSETSVGQHHLHHHHLHGDGHMIHQKKGGVTTGTGTVVVGGGAALGQHQVTGGDKYAAIKIMENGGAGMAANDSRVTGNGDGSGLHHHQQQQKQLHHHHHHLAGDDLKETKLAHSEKMYLEQSIDDSLHIPSHTVYLPHGPNISEINRITPLKRHHQNADGTITAEYQPDLLPNNTQKSFGTNNKSHSNNSLYSPTTTTTIPTTINHQTSYDSQLHDSYSHHHHHQQPHNYRPQSPTAPSLSSSSLTAAKHHPSPAMQDNISTANSTSASAVHYTNNNNSSSNSNLAKSKYDHVTRTTTDYLHSRYMNLMREMSCIPAPASSSPTASGTGGSESSPPPPAPAPAYEKSKQLLRYPSTGSYMRPPPTVNNSSNVLDYRQPPPPPPYTATTTAGSTTVPSRRTSITQRAEVGDVTESSQSDLGNNCYRDDTTNISRQTIVTTSPSLNFLSNYTPRRQLL